MISAMTPGTNLKLASFSEVSLISRRSQASSSAACGSASFSSWPTIAA